jgi:enamine deaminase RidA (YjgF/YER057c/UK114 family)
MVEGRVITVILGVKFLDGKAPSVESPTMRFLQPEGWPRPRGYANGVLAEGPFVFTAGQVGWNASEQFESDDLVDQIRQTLSNVRDVLAEAGCGPQDVVRMTWYVTDIEGWRTRSREIGEAYRSVFGRHFPAMATVAVAALVEPRAKVEIEATAAVPSIQEPTVP